jgi:O-antigen/teichoic acid export membrane protein
LVNGLIQKSKTLQARIVSGSVVLLSGSGLTTAINLAYNIAVARFLGPKGFGHATVVYTILTLMSAVTLSFQIISTKVVAQQASPEGKTAVYRVFHRAAWACGILVALVLLLFQKPIADYLNLPSSALVAILAIGIAFYVPLGARRGYIQGTYGFRRFATNLVIEGACRLGGSVLMILLDQGVEGVIAANTAAVAVAYLAAAPRLTGRIANPLNSSPMPFAKSAMQWFSTPDRSSSTTATSSWSSTFLLPAMPASMPPWPWWAGSSLPFPRRSSTACSRWWPAPATKREKISRSSPLRSSWCLGTGSALALGLGLAPASLWTRFFGPGFAVAGRIQPALSAGALCHYHNYLLAQRGDHHLRNVLQDRQYQLGAVGLQRLGHRSPFASSMGHCAKSSWCSWS